MLEFTIKVDIERNDIFDVTRKIREVLSENNFKISSLETDRKKAFISTQIRKNYSYQQDTIIDFQYIFEINQSDKDNIIKLKLINRNIDRKLPLSRDYFKENTIENDFYLFMKNLIERYY